MWGVTALESIGTHVALLRAPGLALIVGSPGLARLEDGWVAPRYGHKVPAPVLSVAADELASATFTTVIVPRPLDQPTPMVRFGVGRVEVSGVGRGGAQRDVATWNASSAAWARHRASGAVARQVTCA
jgi:hypothetical protein